MLPFLAGLGLGLPSGLFHSGFPTKTLYTFTVSPRSTTCSAHLILSDLIPLTTFSQQHKSWSSSQRSLLQPPVTSSLFLTVRLPSLMSCRNIRSILRPYETFCNMLIFFLWVVGPSPNPSWRSTPCRPSATAYSQLQTVCSVPNVRPRHAAQRCHCQQYTAATAADICNKTQFTTGRIHASCSLICSPHDIVQYRRCQRRRRHAQGNYDAMSSSGAADRDGWKVTGRGTGSRCSTGTPVHW